MKETEPARSVVWMWLRSDLAPYASCGVVWTKPEEPMAGGPFRLRAFQSRASPDDGRNSGWNGSPSTLELIGWKPILTVDGPTRRVRLQLSVSLQVAGGIAGLTGRSAWYG